MKRIPLTQGQFTIVDNKDYEWLSQWKWHARWSENNKSFYAMRYGKERLISMAREILELKYGDKRQADHIDHKTLDNRRTNLRITTHQQNQWNHKNPKGYHWNKSARKYEAQITLKGKSIYLGCFETAKEAHNAYLKAKEKYHR